MKDDKRAKVQAYIKKIFGNPNIKVQPGQGKGSPDELFVGSEFVGVVYENDDDGEISYDFIMSIIEEDLK